MIDWLQKSNCKKLSNWSCIEVYVWGNFYKTLINFMFWQLIAEGCGIQIISSYIIIFFKSKFTTGHVIRRGPLFLGPAIHVKLNFRYCWQYCTKLFKKYVNLELVLALPLESIHSNWNDLKRTLIIQFVSIVGTRSKKCAYSFW